ncbi:MAG: leucyl-tRNA synthetase [Candidatus Azotimanducaceae bacterium]|jgi:leucyl-tRNA synthetase
MHKKFNNRVIEKKWQEKWRESGIYDVGERDSSKEKEYVLVEWPYPSGNLHIGHWYAFATPDIYVRFGRMSGKQMLYPIGFDAFGLPAENAAIKNYINPKEWTETNIEYMQEQLTSMGAAFSWDKTTSSTDQDYYKWTQWMFAEFFKNDIAYRGSGVVNWCPGCNTVVANEQVSPEGLCDRSGDLIEKKEMPQWMFRITKYADRLIDDLDTIEWPEHIKEAQRQWIGRSNGAELSFILSTGDALDVFTTRPDTLFGVTYMVMAPEHELIQKNKCSITNWDEAVRYIELSKQKAERDRLDATKEKTGIKLEGITATNPASGEEIPVYIADYVLAGYGTGAIMAVPAHDERDHEFAKDFRLPIIEVIDREALTSKRGEVAEFDFDTLVTGHGRLVNSEEFNGMDSEEAKKAIVKKVGGRMTSTYRLRDWSVGRQRYWGVPIPIVYDPEGKAHPIPEEHLPWILPEDVDFKPTGEAPLAKSEALLQRTEEIFGKGWTPEVETMDTFLDSSWYFLRYLDNANDSCASSLERQKEWMPIDMYFGGAEHTTMHLLYSRFWQKALFDLGLVTENEPYKGRINRGTILGPDGNKMSKSKGNVIDPDEQVALVGADAVKMYLAFMGPYGEASNYPWDTGGIAGLRRFLERVYGLSEHIVENEPESITKLLHKTIQKVAADIPAYKFNTAISSMMIFVNAAEKEGLSQETYEIFLKVLAPFAPHLAEELWEELGKEASLHLEAFPKVDQNLAKDDVVTIGVQINGKMRGTVTIAPDASENIAMEAIQTDVVLTEKIACTEIMKVIYVPGKILNIILSK